jgi:pimeloyl-ACP methyl ester carboxylesterase
MGGAATAWASRRRRLASRVVMIAPPSDYREATRSLATLLGLSDEVRARVHRRLELRFRVPIEDVRVDRLTGAMLGRVLVVHDENDREISVSCGERVAHAWPQAELVRTRGLGHTRILRDDSTLELIVAFVAQG